MHIISLVFYPMSYKVRQIICPLGNLTIHWNLHFVFFFCGMKKYVLGCVGAPLRWLLVLIGKFLFHVYVLLVCDKL